MKVKSILVSQPEPSAENNPYAALAVKHKIKIDFRPFIKVEGVPASDFRRDKVNPGAFSSVIFTSKNAVDHYFRICQEMRVEVNAEWKYYCVSEAVAFYLQKFVQYRKRKIYPAKGTLEDLIPTLKKHKDEHFLFPTSDIWKDDIPALLDANKLKYTRAILFRTVASDLSDLAEVKYDILAFFSPEGIRSLYKNFPDFVQNETRIAAFGSSTQQAARDHNLRLDIPVPTPEAPSMTAALDLYTKEANKGK
jgi:uroporphyrinogen-III synthase